MRRVIALIVAVLSLCMALALPVGSPEAAEMKPKIAVFMFVSQNIEALSLMDSIPSLLTMSLSNTNVFEIIERKKIDKAIELEGYKLGSITHNELYRVGEKLGFDFALIGDVIKQRAAITVNIKLLDVRKRVVCLEHAVTTTEGGLNDRINEVVPVIIQKSSDSLFPVVHDGGREETLVNPPYNLKTRGGANRIRVDWNYAAQQSVSGYKVYRSGSESGPYMQTGTVTELFFIDDNLPQGETFYYKVTAMNRRGTEGGFSAAIEARTLVVPAQPIFLNTEPDIKAAHLKWRIRPGAEASGFKIFRKDATDRDFKEISSIASENLEYTDRGLKDDTTYFYALTAVDSKGVESDMSQILDVRTFKAPVMLKAESGKIRRVDLSWNGLTSEVVKGYMIYRAADKTGEYKQAARIMDRAINTYTDKDGLGDSLTYWYRISAFSRNGSETALSAALPAATRGAPPVPTGLRANNREPRKVSLKWDIVISPDDEIRGYQVYRSLNENGDYENISRKTDSDSGSYIDNDQNLKDNTAYFYKVASYNSAGVSSQLSDPVTSITKNTPSIPKGLSAKSGEIKQITLTWSRNPETDIKEYLIFRSTAGDMNLRRLTSVKGSGYIDTGLKDGTGYAYSVQAIDQDGLSSEKAMSVTAITKPLPARPSGVKLFEVGGKKYLKWDMNTESDVKKYNIYKKGFLGITQKLDAVSESSWVINDDIKGNIEIFVTALDDSGLESDLSDVVKITLEKK